MSTQASQVKVWWICTATKETKKPGCKDFCEKKSAEIAKEKHYTEVVIRSVPHKTTRANGKYVPDGMHFTADFYNPSTDMWTTVHIYTNNDGIGLHESVTENPKWYPEQVQAPHKDKKQVGDINTFEALRKQFRFLSSHRKKASPQRRFPHAKGLNQHLALLVNSDSCASSSSFLVSAIA